MKKIISLMLAVVMLVLCLGTTAVAAPVETNFNGNTLYNLIDLLDRNMPLTQGQRVEVFELFEVYAQTSTSLGSLISVLDTVTDSGSTVSGTINDLLFNNIIGNIGDTLAGNKDAIKLALSIIRALPDGKRAAAIADFRAAQETVDQALDGGWATEEQAGVVLTTVNQTALQAVYNEFVHNNGDELGDGQLGTHGIGPNTILRLAKAFQGSLKVTDASVGSANFAVYEVSDTFKTNLQTYVSEHFSKINGNSVTSGDVVLNAMMIALNGLDNTTKQNIKTVLGASEIALYTPATSSDGGGSSSGGGGTMPSKPSTPDKFTPVTSNEPQAPLKADEAYIYTDTVDHWAKDYIAALSKRGIFNGYGDGTYKPDMGITREEIAVALTRALGLESQAVSVKNYQFEDSAYISLWAKDAVNMMVKMGIFEGYDDGEYKPKRIITREEMVAVIMRMFSDDLEKAQLLYEDHHEIGDWAREYLEKATNMSIVSGYPDGTFRPVNSITRAEAAKILYNFMHYAGLL